MSIGPNSTFADLVAYIISFIQLLVPVLTALALVLFFIGVFNYVRKAGDSQGKDADKRTIMWGLIALFVLFSIWGILRVLGNTFLSGGAGGGAPTSQQNPWMQDPWEGLR
jgi:branched-subunit amino acid permease